MSEPAHVRLVAHRTAATRLAETFWLQHRRVVAGMNVNVQDVDEHMQTLIRSRRTVDAPALADPDTPLESPIALERPPAQ
jgi:Reductase C-terminal